jgi:hypothetical protein
VLGRIFEGFSMILGDCSNKKKRNGAEVNKTLRGRMNFAGRLLKKHANFAQKQQKNDAILQWEKDWPQKFLEI